MERGNPFLLLCLNLSVSVNPFRRFLFKENQEALGLRA
jgi:hypothetical protein